MQTYTKDVAAWPKSHSLSGSAPAVFEDSHQCTSSSQLFLNPHISFSLTQANLLLPTGVTVQDGLKLFPHDPASFE
jgi:hypothetical protein